jgi:hypothetical protein
MLFKITKNSFRLFKLFRLPAAVLPPAPVKGLDPWRNQIFPSFS